MKQRIAVFGSGNDLRGVLCETTSADNKQPCVVFLNSGSTYQAGPRRLYNELARQLAEHGTTSFRFDLSAVGDSQRHDSDLPYDELVIQDIQAALDYVESTLGIQTFVLLGICSGADHAHKYALTDERVVGTVFMDGYAFKTNGYYLRHYLGKLPKLFNPIKLGRWLWHSLISQSKPSVSSSSDSTEYDGFFWAVPDKAKTENELKRLVARRTQMLFLYTIDWNWCINAARQFKEMYSSIDFNNCAEYHYFGDSDHIYTFIKPRQQMTSILLKWLDQSF